MKKLKIKYVSIIVIALFLALLQWPSITLRTGQSDQLNAIKLRGELRLSTFISPLTYFHTSKGASGLDYELAKRLAAYLGVRLTVKERKNINELFNDLHNDDADIISAGLIYNPERLKYARPGPTNYLVSQQLVYRLGSTPRPKNLADLKGKFVVASGSAHHSTLKQLKTKKFPQLTWEVTNDFTPKMLLEQVATGKLDYTIGDSASIALLQRVYPQLTIAFDIADEEPVTWYLQKNSSDDLYAAILDFYSQLIEDGSYARLEEKYFGHVGNFDYVDTRTFLAAIDNVLPAFRSLFEKYADAIDWKLLAVIAYQESHWNPQATSPTGVRGLMMLTRATAEGLGVKDRLDPEESIQGGARYLQRLMDRVPKSIPEDERIWFALAAYNMGWGHMLDARQLTKNQNGNPDSWADVKLRLSLLSQKQYADQLTYGYARGYEAYRYVENIRRYQVSLIGYLQEKDKAIAQAERELIASAYPVVTPTLVFNH